MGLLYRIDLTGLLSSQGRRKNTPSAANIPNTPGNCEPNRGGIALNTE